MINQFINFFSNSPVPPMIIFDVTNICNLNCIHCPHELLKKGGLYKPKNITIDNFNKAMSELSKIIQPFLLRFCGDGEPLIHPHLIEMIINAKSKTNAIVNLTTNGQYLNQTTAKTLIDAKIDLIDISIDAITAPTYEKIRRGGRYDLLLKNLHGLLDLRSKKNSTKIMVSFIAQQENIHEQESFKSYWEPLVDYVIIRNLHSASGKIKREESVEKNMPVPIERYPCPHLWKRLTIDFNGDIKFCAHDWDGNSSMVLGNIETSTLKAAWQGSELKSLRKMHTSGNINENIICSTCTDWAASKWDYGYERLVDKVVFNQPTLFPCLPLLP